MWLRQEHTQVKYIMVPCSKSRFIVVIIILKDAPRHWAKWHSAYDIQHNDIMNNNIKHNCAQHMDLFVTPCITTLYHNAWCRDADFLFIYCYAECHYTEWKKEKKKEWEREKASKRENEQTNERKKERKKVINKQPNKQGKKDYPQQ